MHDSHAWALDRRTFTTHMAALIHDHSHIDHGSAAACGERFAQPQRL
jgi:hypothetical protein